MISPHTPPGTFVSFVAGFLVRVDMQDKEVGERFSKSEVHILRSIEPYKDSPTGFVATLEAFPYSCFDLKTLRKLDLPKSLTSVLDEQPVDLEEV